ncbi:uncharacterized protein IL334_007976 [Kwoniella shivajii]|uniref:Uncharacterized protein n=1 Tax=Kwoniella shivajii TaxID=564305 RepID=A0ABZ1DE24_9TREE|nr:hypothetical protein IL334_007976 [Kwoniella shivajii]
MSSTPKSLSVRHTVLQQILSQISMADRARQSPSKTFDPQADERDQVNVLFYFAIYQRILDEYDFIEDDKETAMSARRDYGLAFGGRKYSIPKCFWESEKFDETANQMVRYINDSKDLMDITMEDLLDSTSQCQREVNDVISIEASNQNLRSSAEGFNDVFSEIGSPELGRAEQIFHLDGNVQDERDQGVSSEISSMAYLH